MLLIPTNEVQVEDELKAATQPPRQQDVTEETSPSEEAPQNGHADAMETGESPAAEKREEENLSPLEAMQQSRSNKLLRIIRGEASIQLYLEFLHSHNHADLQVGFGLSCQLQAVMEHKKIDWRHIKGFKY